MAGTVTTEVKQGIGIVTLNRPEQLNSLNRTVLEELMTAVKSCEHNAQVRVVVLTGAGEKAFCAGADIKAMNDMDFAGADEFSRLGHQCMSAIENLGKPVIGMVNGFALGGGFELALACDFLYAADTAQLGLPETKIGLFPGFGGTQRLLRLVGRARAMELVFSGRKVKAAQAYEWGIVNKVVAKAELTAAVEATAKEIAANAPVAIQCAKRVMLKGQEMGLTAGLAFERETFPICFATQDSKEGFKAFIEGRPAVFQGK